MQQESHTNQYFLAEPIISKRENLIHFLAKILTNTIIIKSLYIKSFGLVCTYLNILIKKSDNDLYETHRIIMLCLQSKHYMKQKHSDKWWFLMRIAIVTLQQAQLLHHKLYPNIEDALMELGQNSPHPETGYNASYSFVGFALWAFERGLINQAIDFAKQAQSAYDIWGYPDYLIGWFGLFNQNIDSEDYFCKAVTKDWSMLHRIRHDPACQMFPNIIKNVSHKVFVANSKNS